MAKSVLTKQRLDIGIGTLTLMSVGLLGYSVLRSTKPKKKRKKKKENKNNSTSNNSEKNIETSKKKYHITVNSDFDISFVMSSFDGFDALISAEAKNLTYKLKFGSKLIKINNESLKDLTFQEICDKLKKTKKNASKKENEKIKLTFVENDKLFNDWKQASILKDESNKLYQSGKIDEAINKLSEGIQLHETNKVYYSNRILMYLKLKKYDLALDDCYKIRELDPNGSYVKGQHLRGLVLQNKKQYLSAIDAFQNTLKLGNYPPAKARLDECMKYYHYIRLIENYVTHIDDQEKIIPVIMDYIQ